MYLHTHTHTYAHSRWFSRGGLKLTTRLLLMSRLRMNRIMPPLLMYAFTAWTGTTLPLLHIYTHTLWLLTSLWLTLWHYPV